MSVNITIVITELWILHKGFKKEQRLVEVILGVCVCFTLPI
jgi:hypothetical protein